MTEPKKIVKLKNYALRAFFIMAFMAFWFSSQFFIGGKEMPLCGITDVLLILLAPINQFLSEHKLLSDAVLIFSSFIIDMMLIWLALLAIFGSSIRPILGLFVIIILRQICQVLVAVPYPEGIIWYEPPIPSLTVTYSVSTDFFFSSHTAVAVYAATELARLKSVLWKYVGIAIVIFEIIVVLSLRVHYTMDIYAGLVTGLLVAAYVDDWAKKIDEKITIKT